MNKKMRELYASYKEKVELARRLNDEGKTDEAKAAIDEANEIKAKYELEASIYRAEKSEIPTEQPENSDKADGFKAFAKIISGGKLTEAEAALITGDKAVSGENYLVPADVRTQINELRRDYPSAIELTTLMTTESLTGSYVYEDGTLTGLVSFSDGDALTEAAPKFKQLNWTVKPKGAIMPVSNILRNAEKASLMEYLNRWFVRKAIKSENADIFTALKANKTAKDVSGLVALYEHYIKTVPTALMPNNVIATNRSGLAAMLAETDKNGRPLVTPDLTKPDSYVFKGMTVYAFPDAELADVTGKHPVFIGNIKAGMSFIRHSMTEFAVSDHVFFNKNQSAVRMVELYTPLQTDKAAYEYCLLGAAASS